MIKNLTALVLCALIATPAIAQNGNRPTRLRVFLDCSGRGSCDREFIRTEIDYVDHVRDQMASDVHVLVTTERTASGGQSYTLAFLGRGRFAAISDTLVYSSLGSDTSTEQREGMTRMLAAGLIPYIARTTMADRLRVGVDRNGAEPVLEEPTDDPWNYWIFRLDLSGSHDAEQQRKSWRTNGNVSASRTTEDWKVRLNARGNYRQSRYILNDTTIVDNQQDGNLFAFVARSLDPHWSAGGSVNASTSTRRNISYAMNAGPAIEYNIFPYSESTRRELRLQYEVDVHFVEYEKMTVFGRIEDVLLSHGFEINFDLRQPWGGAGAGVEVTHYLTDFKESRTDFYSVEIDGRINVRLMRGLGVRLSAGWERVRDQLYLPQEDASDEDILLGRRALKTDYEFRIEAGINYTFGSIYNNVVNTRFGGF